MSLVGRRVLVAGGSGFVGSHIVRRLIAEEAIVRAVLHRRPPVVVDPRVEYVEADLTIPADCRRVVRGQEWVCMCAAVTSGAAVIRETPMVHVTPNVIMNALMLEAAHEARVSKFLWLSSSTGYPPTDGRPVREAEMFEGEPHESYYCVGWMKRFTEILCTMYGEKLSRTMPTFVLRPTNLYGPYDDFEPGTSHVTAALVRKVVERQDPIEVWGNGEDVRDLVFVDDAVEAVVRALTTLDSHAVLNLGAGRGYSVKEILETLLKLDGYEGARVVFDHTKPSTIPIRLVDTSAAELILGFRAQTPLRVGLAQTLAWYRESLLQSQSASCTEVHRCT